LTFVESKTKKPRTFLFRALGKMVPRPGIEPGTRGFSINDAPITLL